MLRLVWTTLRRALMIALERLLVMRFNGNAVRLVALTFDDGPHAVQTPKLLEVLCELGVPATFFLIGLHVRENPHVARALADAGMEIGNHGWRHISLRGLPFEEQVREIAHGAREISTAAGQPIRLFRPPFGDFDDRTAAAAAAAGQKLVFWNGNAHEWTGIDPIATVTRVVAAARAPAVILMHDASAATVAAVPRIVAAYRRAGFRFVSVSELLQASALTSATPSSVSTKRISASTPA